ncbi:MAG: fasciclin protein [Sphingobacteriales bacterium]|nr:fasciclin protein [Sphingobacteriales bacterium]
MKKSIFIVAATLSATISMNAFAQVSKTDTTKTTGTTTATSPSTTPSSSSTTTATTTTAATSSTVSASKVTFESLLETSGLNETLQGEYTFFAPSDVSLAKAFPAGVDSTAEGKAQVTALLSNHIVKGKLTSKDLAKAIAKGKGSSTLNTIGGEKITVKINESKNLEVADANGNTAVAIGFDKPSTKGIVHQIDKALTSK